MRIHFLGIVGVAALGGCHGELVPEEDPSKPLDEFVGRDFGSLSEAEYGRLKDALRGLPGLTFPCGDELRTGPCHLWRHRGGDGTDELILFAAGVGERPGRAAVRFLTPHGQQVAGVPFFTGWKTSAEGTAEYVQHPTFGPVLIVHTVPGPNSRGLVRQVYVIDEHRLALLRLEGEGGVGMSNNYRHWSRQVGPSPPIRSPAEWERMLTAGDMVQALEALTWLGGYHRENLDEDGFPRGQTAEEVRFVQAVRRRPGVRAAFRQLAANAHPWVREAAQLAIAVEGE